MSQQLPLASPDLEALRALLSARDLELPALLAGLWDGPWPAFVQDGKGQVLLANNALAELSGESAEALVGRRLLPSGRGQELHLRDHWGREHWLQASLQPLDARGLGLCLLQDRTGELAARERTERMQSEIEQWLDLSPLPALMFDARGLVLRHNQAFARLCRPLLPDAPASLHELPRELQRLLGWQGQAMAAGTAELALEGLLPGVDGRRHWLRARVRPVELDGRQRYLAWLEDRSAEQERELAHQQLQALVDTAGVGLATYQQDSGWSVASPGPASAASGGSRTAAALQGVNREMVLPESLPDYERLQQALKNGQRCSVRYAVRHAQLGQRWLLTRVEPGRLASGQLTTSVLTLDITEEQQALVRMEQLLRELSTIMDGAGLGLAYFRNSQLLRSNGAFGRMLGLAREPEPGSALAPLFQALPELGQQVLGGLPALGEAGLEFEFQLPNGPHPGPWHALTVRRVPGMAEQALVLVVSDISRLKAQQAQLAALAHDRELMFSLSDVGIAILREDRIVRANEALALLLGYRGDEIAGVPLSELFESRAQYEHERGAVEQALASQGLWRGERRVRRRDGSVLWMQVSKRRLRADDPGAGVIATYLSVDERHRAQQSLLLQTERERAVLDSVLVGIVTVGRSGIEWMNRSARRMFGGDLAEFAGQPMSMVAGDDPDHPFHHTHYLDELAEGQAETFECRLKARDGREFWVVGNAVVTGGAGSGGRQLTYALLDIERRRQAEAQTLQAQASLRRIIEAAPIAISLHDAKTLQVEQINQAAAALAGRSEDELLGASPESLFGEQAAALRVDMEAALQSSEVLQREYRLSLRGEPRIWDTRLLHLSGVNDASGAVEPEQLLLVASDVTQQRAQEAARLEAAIAQRELLVREVHHRIKNNLQGVAGLLQQIAARRPEVQGVINEAVGQVQAIAQVYGLQVGVSGPLRLRKVAEAIMGSVQRMFGRDILVQVQGEALAHAWGLPEAESIPIALTLNELLTNAVKHGQGQPVHCRLDFQAEQVLLQIRNTGTLPAGFELAQVRGGVSGLGLVRALLPRRSATLALHQDGEQVLCQLALKPPGVSLLEPI